MPGSPTIRFLFPFAKSAIAKGTRSSKRAIWPYLSKSSFASVNEEYIFVNGLIYGIKIFITNRILLKNLGFSEFCNPIINWLNVPTQPFTDTGKDGNLSTVNIDL